MKTKNKIIFTLFSALVLLIFKKKDSIMNKIWDTYSENKITSLHPAVRAKAIEFVTKAEKQGIQLRITSGYRTHALQNELYSQGRTKPGTIITNAKGGQSFHNFGLAIDVVPIVNGAAVWNTDWNKIAVIGKSVGFQWGGDFISFKDKAHFEMKFGNTLAQIQNKYNSGQLSNGYIQLT